MVDIGADMRNLVQPECLKEDAECVKTEKSEKDTPKQDNLNACRKKVIKRRKHKFKQPPRNRRGARV